MNLSEIKIGILGGGQLGKMLVNAATQWSIQTYVLDPSEECPAAKSCSFFVKGDFKNYDDVYSFGKMVDFLTIEIENINTDALKQLAIEEKKIYPQPEILHLIKDKNLQKEFYKKNNFPSPKYSWFENKEKIFEAIQSQKLQFPFVQKLCKAGYDGKGVAVIKNQNQVSNLLEGESIVEELIDIQKEISVIVARNSAGEIVAYPPVEMTFNSSANLVENLICPAQIDEKIIQQATDLACSVIKSFNLIGILAVEMFLDTKNNILINEVAPRPHNSGHQTIESSYTSQYFQLIRAILDLPLGSTQLISPSIMLNLLGEPDYTGVPIIQGFNDCIKMEGVNIHLYGKKETRPFRKMGHITIVDSNIESAKQKADFIKKTIKIIS